MNPKIGHHLGPLAALQPPPLHGGRRCSKSDSRDLVLGVFTTACILPLLIQIPDLRRQRQHGRILSLDRRARSVETASSLAFESIDRNAVEVRKVEFVLIVASPANTGETLGGQWHDDVVVASGAASGSPVALAVQLGECIGH